MRSQLMWCMTTSAKMLRNDGVTKWWNVMKWRNYVKTRFCNSVIKQRVYYYIRFRKKSNKPAAVMYMNTFESLEKWITSSVNLSVEFIVSRYFMSHHRSRWATVQTNNAICVHISPDHTLHEVQFHLEELLTVKMVLNWNSAGA